MTAPASENSQPPLAYEGPPALRLITGGATADPPAAEFAPWELHSELVLVCAELRARSLELLPEIELDTSLAASRKPVVRRHAEETRPAPSRRSATLVGMLLALAVFVGLLASRRA